MVSRPDLKAFALFLGAALVVVVGLVGLTASTTPAPEEPVDGFPDPTTDLVAETEVTGTIEVPTTDAPGVVLVDMAHANRASPEQLRPLVGAITEAGYEVAYLEDAENLERELARADAFVVVDPADSYEGTEARAVERFAESGGRVVIFGEPTRTDIVFSGLGSTTSTDRSHLASLGAPLGIHFGTEYLYNLDDNDGNFKNVFGTGTDGDVDRVTFYTATRVTASSGQRLLETVPGTRTAGSSETRTHPVAVRSGNVIAVGDATFLTEGNHAVADNDDFLGRVATFLVAGERTPDLLSYPAAFGSSPKLSYSDADLLGAAQDLAAQTREATGTPTIRYRPAAAWEADIAIVSYDYLATTDLGTGIAVEDETIRVDGYSVARNNTTIAIANRAGYDLVIAAPGGEGAEAAVERIAEGTIVDATVTAKVALIVE